MVQTVPNPSHVSWEKHGCHHVTLVWNMLEAHLLRIHRSKTCFEGWLSDPESGIRSVCQKKVPIGTAQCTIWSRHVSSWTSTHHTQFTYFQLLHSYDLISDVISALNANLYLSLFDMVLLFVPQHIIGTGGFASTRSLRVQRGTRHPNAPATSNILLSESHQLPFDAHNRLTCR